MRLRIAVTAVLAVVLGAPACFAQNCALCYTTASALGASARRSLDFGILSLLTPALVMFLAVFYLLFRRALAASASA